MITVMTLIARRFNRQYTSACRVHLAVDLYRAAQLLPSTFTSSVMAQQHQLQLHGRCAEEFPHCILTATDKKGRPRIVRLLGCAVSRPTAHASEADVCERLELAKAHEEGTPVAHIKLIDVDLNPEDSCCSTKHGAGVYRALLMPRCVCAVSAQPQLRQMVMARGGARFVQAVEYMHSKRHVHIYIKGADVFVDADGNWFLGDFGSTVVIGDPVHSYTQCFYRNDILRQPAQPAFDWYMLAVMLAVELHKEKWREQLLDGDCVTDSKLCAAASAATLEGLKDNLQLAMERGQIADDAS
ncbi:hypothetical protein JKP88DRAFT_162951 [Tribonema minus]|uniref:Protein kinase domain-containing protein n=1 Tax=Tribonema minus TaxID=303371 RepID=A0A835Z0R0_9STRA|nr:hypothetical protein JKP88DRAFT_162951 [Tribonema minus]